jgi:3-phenylpropionate/cinnamic acid dioxygenase small subunit
LSLSPETQITNVLYRYAELIDTGDFDAIADLFSDARLNVLDSGGMADLPGPEIARIFGEQVRRYDDGTPRTKHVITNPIVEVDEAAGTATCRSYYTVVQQAGTGPLRPIIAGRYHDQFTRIDGTWRFTHRDYSLVDLVGDLSDHLPRAEVMVPGPCHSGRRATCVTSRHCAGSSLARRLHPSAPSVRTS